MSSSWIIVWCETDTSFSLIRETDAVFDGDCLAIGDEVKFFFNRNEYIGEVRKMGGDDDYDDLNKCLAELNSSNKAQQESFHADRPRKNKGRKFSDALAALKPVKRATKSSRHPSSRSEKIISEPPNMPLKQSPLAELLHNDGEDIQEFLDDPDEIVDSSPKSSPTQEDLSEKEKIEAIQVKRKNAVMGREADLKALKRLKLTGQQKIHEEVFADYESQNDGVCLPKFTSTPVNSKSTYTYGDSTSKSRGEAQESKQSSSAASKSSNTPTRRISIINLSNKRNAVYEDSEAEEQPETVAAEGDEKKKKKKEPNTTSEEQPEPQAAEEGDDKKKKKKKRSKNKETKEISQDPLADMLRCSKSDANVIEVRGRSRGMEDKAIFITMQAMQTAKLAPNASQFAKNLLVATFSDRALLQCSVSGGQYRAGGKANITQKPPLDQDALAVIVDVAIHRQNVKKWKPELSRREILAGLRQKLVDVKPRLRSLLHKDGDSV